MQLKGLALKKTPIYADSAVSRHEGLDEEKNARKGCAECKKKKGVEGMTSIVF